VVLLLGAGFGYVIIKPAIYAARDAARRSAWKAEGPWTTYTNPGFEYSVSFPGEPKTEVKSMPGPRGVSVHVEATGFKPASSIEYGVAVATASGARLPSELTSEQIAEALKQFDPDVRIVATKKIQIEAFLDSSDVRGRQFGAYPGQEVDFEAPSKNLCGTAKVIVRSSRMYMVSWIGPANKKSVCDVPRFLDSFEFLPRPDKRTVGTPPSELFGGMRAMRVEVPGVPAIVSLPMDMRPVDIASRPKCAKPPNTDVPGLKATYECYRGGGAQGRDAFHFYYCYLISADPATDAMGPVLERLGACIEGKAKWDSKDVEAQGPDGKPVKLRMASATGKQEFHFFIPNSGAGVKIDDTLPTSVMEGVLQVWDREIEPGGAHLFIVWRVPDQFAAKEVNCYEFGKAMAASVTPK